MMRKTICGLSSSLLVEVKISVICACIYSYVNLTSMGLAQACPSKLISVLYKYLYGAQLSSSGYIILRVRYSIITLVEFELKVRMYVAMYIHK